MARLVAVTGYETCLDDADTTDFDTALSTTGTSQATPSTAPMLLLALTAPALMGISHRIIHHETDAQAVATTKGGSVRSPPVASTV